MSRGMIPRLLLLATSTVTLLACGGRVVGEASAGADDASMSGDSAIAAIDAGAADADARDPLQCPGVPPIPFDRSCNSVGDCVAAYVYAGCCLTDALGVSARDVARFTDAAADCARLDPCDCAGNRTIADDGRPSIDPMHRDVVVECTRGECRTRIR